MGFSLGDLPIAKRVEFLRNIVVLMSTLRS
jgi:hypothetical protein